MTFGRRDIEQYAKDRAARKAANMAVLALPSRSLHKPTYSGDTSGVAVAKEKPLQSTRYMKAVRDLGYCMLCRRSCRPQFCHADFRKGAGIKTDCRLGWPGCGPGPWGMGCHWIVGTSGTYPKEERRELEAQLAHRTRAALIAAGLWPDGIERWSEA